MNEDCGTLFDLYRDEIKRLSPEYHTAGGVLYSCVLSVINFNTQDDAAKNLKNHSMAPINDVYSPTGEFIQLQTTGKNGIFQGLVQSVHGPIYSETDIIASEIDDALAARLSKAPISIQKSEASMKQEHTRASVMGLILFERHAIVRAQVSNLLDAQALPLKPEMTSTERGIKETELLSFSSLSTSDLYRNDQMQTIAKMLDAHVRALPNFTGTLRTSGDDGSILRRRFFRHLSAQTFAQILSAEKVREPIVVKQYYPLTDDLLLALHWPPPERRIRQESWTWTGPIPVVNDPAAVAAALAKEEALKGKKKGKAKKTSPKKGSQKMEVAAPTTMSCTISTTTLTPAAHSIAMIKRSAQPSALSWLSIHVNGSILGLRMETCSILVADLLTEQELAEDHQQETRSIRSAHSHDSAIDAAEGEMPGSPVGSVHSASHPDVSAAKLSVADSSRSLGLAQQEPPRGMFFCHTEDDIRFSACAGPAPQPVLKPDGFGTICLIATFPDAMSVTICSNGTTKIALPIPSTSVPIAAQLSSGALVFDSVVGAETDRFIGAGGIVMSNYSKISTTFTNSDGAPAQFSKEIREADGSRLLILRTSFNAVASLAASFGAAQVTDNAPMSRQQSNLTSQSQFGGFKKGSMGAFYQTLCSGAPQGWTCVKLGADGSVVFHTCPPDSSLLQSATGVPHPSLHQNIRTALVDAETKATVSTFQDGRVVIQYLDGRVESKFGDGTVITTHAAGAMVSISKPNLPSIEVDTEIDAVSRQHARGIEVPINKGGERVRSRIALPDGTAVLVKYDTRLTTITNGSIKVVRRDKTTFLLKDSGSVTYTPRAAWSAKSAAVFAAECADLPAPPVASPARVTIAPGNTTAHLGGGHSLSPTSRATSTAAPHSPTSQSHSGMQSLNSVDIGSVAGLNNSIAKRSVSTVNTKRRKTSPIRGRTTTNNTQGNKSAVGLEGTEEKEAEDASFTFDIIAFKCRILDYEFNSFEIDLASEAALSPAVVLSGEVEGLKPPAVADKPMDPRLFVISRSAEATELLSGNSVATIETLARTCPDVSKVSSQVLLPPSDLGPATLSKYFVRRRLLGARGDGFTFPEVFGARHWYPHIPPAAALMAEHNNQLVIKKMNKKRAPSHTLNEAHTSLLPVRYYDICSIVEQAPLSADGHVQMQLAIKKCDDFRAARLTSLDRFKVEEDRTEEELEEEAALAKRLKIAFKAAKVNAAKKKEQKAKMLAAAPPSVPEEPSAISPPGMLKRQTSAIPEGDNEDGDEEDMAQFLDDEEPVVLDPEEMEVRDTFDDFCVQSQNEGFTIDDSFTIAKSSLQEAFIRLFNRYIPAKEIEHEITNCIECDASYDELTYGEFKSLYFSMKQSFASLHYEVDRFPAVRRINTMLSEDSADEGSIGEHTAQSHMSSPTYWQSPQGQKVIRTLPPAAPPLDLRRIEWDHSGAIIKPGKETEDGKAAPATYSEELYGDEVSADEFKEGSEEIQGRMVSTAHPAVGSALQAARRSNTNRAVTAPE